MINQIEIDGFKNLSDVNLRLAPLTILTGKNSTGKSSVLQAILFCQKNSQGALNYPDFVNLDFDSIRNKYQNAKEINIVIENNGNRVAYRFSRDQFLCEHPELLPVIEKGLFYLSANRIGAENFATINPSCVSGPAGNALFGTFELEKSKAVDMSLVRDNNSYTLSSQVNYWMSYILGLDLELHSEKRAANNVEIKYKSDGLPDILPSQLGAGVSYLAKILILCLRSNTGDVIMIENPEIHMYPYAQARLAEFLSFIANNNRQLLIETHSDIIITKVRHEIFKNKLKHDDVLILYKESITSPFSVITIDENGKFNEDFPESFFDATLNELLEMD